MTGPISPEHGAKIAAALKVRAEHRSNMAQKRAQEISEAGKFLPTIADEEWDDILDRIAAGEISAHVMKSLGLSPSTITAKARRDPEFNTRYKNALEDHYIAVFEDVRMVTRGVEGYSTGDTRRDALVAEYDVKIARTMANKVLAERQQVSVTTNMPVMLAPIPDLPMDEIDAEFSVKDDDDDDLSV